MKLDVTRHITDFNENPITKGVSPEGMQAIRQCVQAAEQVYGKDKQSELTQAIDKYLGEPITVRDVLMAGLMVGERQQGQNPKLDWQKNYRYLQKVATEDEVDLDEDSRSYIFEQVEKNCSYTTLVMGRTKELLFSEELRKAAEKQKRKKAAS